MAEAKKTAKATVKKPVAKAAETAAKKTTAKTTAAKTTAAKKTTTKTAAAKTKKAAAVKESISIQFAGKEYTTEQLVKIAKDVRQEVSISDLIISNLITDMRKRKPPQLLIASVAAAVFFCAEPGSRSAADFTGKVFPVNSLINILENRK